MATASITTFTEKPSRRGLLRLLAAATAAAPAALAAAPGAGTPLIVSPEIAAAAGAYWTLQAEANVPGTPDEIVGEKSDAMDVAAARLAVIPCRTVGDLAAKLLLVVGVMNQVDGWRYFTDEEGEVLASAEADALALAGTTEAEMRALLAGPNAVQPAPDEDAADDAELVGACVAALDQRAEIDRLLELQLAANDVGDRDLDDRYFHQARALVVPHHETLAEVAAIPAQSEPAMRRKAEVVLTRVQYDLDGNPCSDDRLVHSLCRDVLALVDAA